VSGHHEHHYETRLRWAGSTAQGYEHYGRAHQLSAPPAATGLELSADPAFVGDPELLNPEALLVAAASSCQLLSFLAVAARARLDVTAYTDQANAVMSNADSPMRITRIDLHPIITLADTDRDRPTPDRLEHWSELAHRQCFIANSLTSEVVVHPEFRWTEV
jgi:organic hydroperoxide reductase OsmC/OhrA